MAQEQVLWPGWETVKVIGKGGFGSVYEIRRDLFGTTESAALKMITIPQSDSEIDELRSDGHDRASIEKTYAQYMQSIISEYTMMRQLGDCPNIVSCDDVRYERHPDGIGWDIFIKMELLTPLTKAFPDRISEQLVLKAGKDLCNALVMCKQFHVLHRDIKPQNIFISKTGEFKLGDFGIAKAAEHTMGGTKIGTYKYMAPEVYNNQPYGSAADIYSLGLVLYWMLNEHRLPFLPMPPAMPTFSDEEQAKLRRFRGEPIPAPKNGSPALKAIVLKACAFNPADRFHSAVEMLSALEKAEITHPFAPVAEKTERVRPADTNENKRMQENPDNRSQVSARNTLPEKPKKKSHAPWLILGAILAILAFLIIYFSSRTPTSNTSSPQQADTSHNTTPSISTQESTPDITTPPSAELVDVYMLKRQQSADGSRQEFYEYDSNNRLICTQFKNNGLETSRYEYQYDGDGKLLLERRVENGEVTFRQEYQYDSAGNMRMNRYIGNDVDPTHLEEQYDNAGNLLVVRYFTHGVETGRNEYQYDSKGKLIAESSFEKDELYSSVEYQYTSNGNIKQEDYWYKHGDPYILVYEYNANGDLTSEIRYVDGNIDNRVNYEYDSCGNLIESYSIGWSRNYQYDTNGNLISYNLYRDGNIQEGEEYEYDNAGNICVVRYIHNGVETGCNEYQYQLVQLPKEDAQQLKAWYEKEYSVEFINIPE